MYYNVSGMNIFTDDMSKSVQNTFYYPEMADRRGREMPPLNLFFEFADGARSLVVCEQTSGWRSMPFNLIGFQMAGRPEEPAYRVEVSGERDRLVPGGELFLIPGGTFHRITNIAGRPFFCAWLHFRLTVLQSLEIADLYQLPPKIGEPAAERLRRILLTLVDTPSPGDLHEAVQLQLLGGELARELLTLAEPKEISALWHSNMYRMLPVFKRLANVENGRPATAELAAAANLSASRFLAIFRSLTGTSPGRYFEQGRIRRSCILLRSSRLTINEIADRLGYADAFHFSRHFKAAMGVSPSAYRAKNWHF